MFKLISRGGLVAIAGVWLVSSSSAQQTAGTALIRHAPTLNGGVQGSVQQMTAENTTFNSGASVTGDLLVPGTPAVRLNGSPTFGGTLDGPGVSTPSRSAAAPAWVIWFAGRIRLRCPRWPPRRRRRARAASR